MNQTTATKRYEAKRQWSQLTKQVKEFEKTLLRLMRHPEATAEQISKAKEAYTELYKSMKETEKNYLTAIKPHHHYEPQSTVSLTDN